MIDRPISTNKKDCKILRASNSRGGMCPMPGDATDSTEASVLFKHCSGMHVNRRL